MARSRSSYFGPARVTRGLLAPNPDGGSSRTSQGFFHNYPSGQAPPAEVASNILTVLTSSSTDARGIPFLIDNDIQSVAFAQVAGAFANPGSEYTGYGADGFWYTAGLLDPTHTPFQAPWASEASGSASLDRGVLDRFPERLFILSTRREVVLLDADSLEVWMRFQAAGFASAGLGPFLGEPGTQIRDAKFLEGFLAIACSDGLRIVDFRRDWSQWFWSAGSVRIREGDRSITLRNSSTFWDGASVLVAAGFTTLSADVLCLDMGKVSLPSGTLKNAKPLIAIGQDVGLSGMAYDGGTGRWVTANTPSTFAVPVAWSLPDDGGGDDATEQFTDTGTDWNAKGVAPGDILSTTADGEIARVSRVSQTSPGELLVLDRRVGLSQGFDKSGYVLGRPVPGVKITQEGGLYFLNGNNRVTFVRNTDWFEDTPTTTIFSASSFNTAEDTSQFSALVDAAYDLDLRGDVAYVATSLGVFCVTDEDLRDGGLSLFIYSTASVSAAEAEYKILEGFDQEAVSLAVDPETGNILVAVLGEGSVVTEINPNIQQAFRFFTGMGRVRSVTAYRNPSGPPDVEIG